MYIHTHGALGCLMPEYGPYLGKASSGSKALEIKLF